MTTQPAAGSFSAWLIASRPATLWAALVPVLVGASCAWAVGGFRLLPSLVALLSACWIQVGTNFANDVFDYEKGADTGERLGPIRAVQAGLLSRKQMRLGMKVAFAIAFAFGLYLTWLAGWPLLVIGIVSILSGIAYTGGPYPLGYNGLGDIFVLVFFGFVAVCGTAYVNLGFIPEIAWWASIPIGSLATAILVVNNVRDRETDVKAGKRTLAVRWGRRMAEAEYAVLLLASYATPFFLLWRGLAGPWVLLPFLTLPLAAKRFHELRIREGRPLNETLVATSKLLLFFGVLFCIGLVVRSSAGSLHMG